MISKYILPPVVILTILTCLYLDFLFKANVSFLSKLAVLVWYYVIPCLLSAYLGSQFSNGDKS